MKNQFSKGRIISKNTETTSLSAAITFHLSIWARRKGTNTALLVAYGLGESPERGNYNERTKIAPIGMPS